MGIFHAEFSRIVGTVPGNSWRSKFSAHGGFGWHLLVPAENSQKMNDENTHPCGYGEGHRLWPRSASISFSKWAFPQGARRSLHLLICLSSPYRTPPSPVKDGFQQELISYSWPGAHLLTIIPHYLILRLTLRGCWWDCWTSWNWCLDTLSTQQLGSHQPEASSITCELSLQLCPCSRTLRHYAPLKITPRCSLIQWLQVDRLHDGLLPVTSVLLSLDTCFTGILKMWSNYVF